MKRILITGGSGLLGSNLAKIAAEKFETYATYNQHPVRIKNCNLIPMDITNLQEVLEKMEEIQPNVIVHTAALTSVDYCDDHPELAWKINVRGTINLAKATERINTFFVYISTDSVFDGKRGLYVEEDVPNPLNYYAKTKLEGEKVVEDSGLNYAIIRTNIYGWNIQNKLSLAEWILDGLKNRKVLTMFKDVFFSPILVNNLADAIIELQERELPGVWHVAGVERCSKLHFAYKMAEIFGFDEPQINPISIDNANLKAPRPKDPSLNVNKARRELSMKLLNVEEGISKMKQLFQDGYVKELKEGFLLRT